MENATIVRQGSSRRGSAAGWVAGGLWVALLGFAALGCGPAPGEEAEVVLAPAAVDPATPRYVLVAADPQGQPQAFARIVLPAGSDCPTVQGDSGLPAGGIAMSPRSADSRFGFPQVCEAAVPFGSKLEIAFADGSTLSLPTARKNPRTILAMGDTGCKLGKEDSTQAGTQTCKAGEPAKEFAAQAQAAASKSWDLILHMGDYNYRGTPSKVHFTSGGHDWSYDAGDGTTAAENCQQSDGSPFISQNAPGSIPQDSWDAWNADFFAPAGELLWAAPWVFARGNHELCSRAGPGWFHFLDASSDLPEGGGRQLSCPAADPPSAQQIDNVVLVPPYVVDLENLRLAVVDSANACDAFATPAMADFLDAYSRQFAELGKLAAGPAPTWLMSHRPVWGVQSYDADKSTPCVPGSTDQSCINQTLQYAIAQGLPGGALPESISLALAGHMHHFQSLTFQGTAGPPQLIVGNGGVSLADWGPIGSFTSTIQQTPVAGRALANQGEAGGSTVSAWGFLEIDYQGAGAWQGALRNGAAGVELASCSSAKVASGSVCDLTVQAVQPGAGE